MKQLNTGRKLGLICLLAGWLLAISGLPAALAEPPVHLAAGNTLSALFAGIGSALTEPAPRKMMRECSQESEACWKSQGMNKNNADQVQDTCWQEAKRCPKVCRDVYFSRRSSGMNGAAADPLFSGRRGEDTSCVPGLDELTHPGRKVQANDSTVLVTVKVGGQVVDAEVDAVALDEKGQELKRTTSTPLYSKYMPAGRHQLRVRSPDRFLHPNHKVMPYQAFPEQTVLISLQAGQVLEKIFTFGMGRLKVQTRSADGKPVAATLEIICTTFSGCRKRIPQDTDLLAGPYRLIASDPKTRQSTTFDIEIKDGQLTTRTITFADNGKPVIAKIKN